MDEDGDLQPTTLGCDRLIHFSFHSRAFARVRTRGWVTLDRGNETRDRRRVWEDAWEAERGGDGMG